MFDLLTASPLLIAVTICVVAGLTRLIVAFRARQRDRAARLKRQRLRRIKQHQREYDENELGWGPAMYLRDVHEGPEPWLTSQRPTRPATSMLPSPPPVWPDRASAVTWDKLGPLG